MNVTYDSLFEATKITFCVTIIMLFILFLTLTGTSPQQNIVFFSVLSGGAFSLLFLFYILINIV